MYDAVCMRWHYNGRNYIFTKKGFPVKLRGLPMNERVKKYLSVMLAYGIPVMLIMKTVPFMSGYLKGLDACVADYFLFFFDWKSNGFICMYEIVLFSFFMVTIIKTELLPNRIVLYNSRIKLFCSCVKKCIALTYLVPLFNAIITMVVSLSNHAVWACNWGAEGSVSKYMLPYCDFAKVSTVTVILASVLADVLRMQATLLIICIVYWLTRSTVFTYILVYINVLAVGILSKIKIMGISFSGVYSKMIIERSYAYVYGIVLKDNVIVPLMIVLILAVSGIVLFRVYRKDIL